MANLIAVLVVLCVVGAAVLYIYKAKKRGQTCIGCPYAKSCAGRCSGGCSEDKPEPQ